MRIWGERVHLVVNGYHPLDRNAPEVPERPFWRPVVVVVVVVVVLLIPRLVSAQCGLPQRRIITPLLWYAGTYTLTATVGDPCADPAVQFTTALTIAVGGIVTPTAMYTDASALVITHSVAVTFTLTSAPLGALTDVTVAGDGDDLAIGDEVTYTYCCNLVNHTFEGLSGWVTAGVVVTTADGAVALWPTEQSVLEAASAVTITAGVTRVCLLFRAYAALAGRTLDVCDGYSEVCYDDVPLSADWAWYTREWTSVSAFRPAFSVIDADTGPRYIDDICVGLGPCDAGGILVLHGAGLSGIPDGEEDVCPAPEGARVTLPLTPLLTFVTSATEGINAWNAALSVAVTATLPISVESIALPFRVGRGLATHFPLIAELLTFTILIASWRLLVVVVVFVRHNTTWFLDLLSQVKQLIWPV